MKKVCIPALLAAFAVPAIAEEAVIDPSDLTRVYTQAAVFITSDADIRTSAMFTGAWSEEIQFAGFVEANWGDRGAEDGDSFGIDYRSARAQYFQVHAIGEGDGIFPRVGASVDLIHQDVVGGDDAYLFSVGTIGLLNPKYTRGKAMLFPNVAYATGEIAGESVDGFMLNLFATIPFGDSGAFIQAWPEYFSVSGDTIELNSTTWNFMVNAPLRSDRTHWLMTKLEYNSTDGVVDGIAFKGDGDLKAEIGMKWFF
ncbi:hypothetical protein [Ferrimonas marina]|uniref:Nucleoside-specific outer membrane channel protein Tsx n=1 Tax=Ferrimonas marina TaxID=299255 RepID=A0A1M5RCG3_9GAMM|nr:hypothetical protein [Ferrimonas marina]SHH24027.1 hypothetical protein SAMN02745129_1571 [Ferrimonas marina]